MAPVMTETSPTLGLAVARGVRERCPRCGEGRLFRRYLKVADRCVSCDLEFGRYPATTARPTLPSHWLATL